MERDSFIFRKKWYEAIKALDADTKAQAFDAICQFALYHKQEENPSPVLRMAMAFIMPDLEEDCKKWMDIKGKRSEAGRKGNEKRWAESQNIAKIANATDESQTSQSIANIAVSSFVNVNNVSFLAHMCAGSEEKKEAFLFEIGKEMLRKGAAKPSKETDLFIAYNDSQGWLLKNGRNISDPVAWAKNWSIKNASDAILRSAEAYILLLRGANINDRKMLDALKEIAVTGNQIIIKLSSKKAAEAFVKAEDSHLESMRTAIEMAFPEIQNPQIQYLSPRS